MRAILSLFNSCLLAALVLINVYLKIYDWAIVDLLIFTFNVAVFLGINLSSDAKEGTQK